jgi:two-component system, OmpR family, KDP operon response regulator KdpE
VAAGALGRADPGGAAVNQPTVLVIEDDRRYRDLLELNLTRQGYRTLPAPDGRTGLHLLEREAPDLVILDLMLPDLDGFDVCRRIREASAVPVIILSARTTEAEKVRGLRLGADDYVTKPFGAAELLARVAAVLRRRRLGAAAGAPAAVVVGELAVDFAARRVAVGGWEVHLTPAEYQLLRDLALNAGRILVPEELLRRVWGPGYEDQHEVLHTTVRRLRRKLEPDPGAPRYVLTRRRIGYLLAASPEPAGR